MKSKPTFSVRRKTPTPKRTVARRPATGGVQRAANAHVTSLARLLADPCGSPLVAPQYGASSGGYLTKLSSFLEVSAAVAGYSSGYIIWFPDYTGDSYSSDANMNLYLFQTGNSATSPLNNASNPCGTGSASSTVGQAIRDPAFEVINGSVVQDARTVSACMKFMYTGRNDSLSGRVGVFNGFSREAFVSGSVGSPPSPNELFQYASHSTRTPMDQVELRFRPSEGSEYFRTSGGTEFQKDTCITLGNPGVIKSSLGDGTTSGTGTGMGFVWAGLDTSSTLAFDFLKAIEWRPAFSSHIVSPQQTISVSGGNMVSRALAYLDLHFPGWTHDLIKQGGSAVAQIAAAAFRGPANAVIRQSIGYAAPLLLM
jgi:hypothetical protein